MESKTVSLMKMKYEPVAIIWADERPEGAKQFKPGKWGCVMFMLAAATRGKTAVFDRETFGCWGGGVGLGFGDLYKSFPGGEDCFCYFLSVGNKEWDKGRKVLEKIKPYMRDESYENFVHGEGYIKSPELVKKFIQCLPIQDIHARYVVMKPLKHVDPHGERPEVVVFLADMDQLAALTVLANYARDDNHNVIMPQAAGCQSIGIYPYEEARSEKPRAVVGLVDISARLALKRQLKDDLMTFAVPFGMFEEMEINAAPSFLERNTWKQLSRLSQ